MLRIPVYLRPVMTWAVESTPWMMWVSTPRLLKKSLALMGAIPAGVGVGLGVDVGLGVGVRVGLGEGVGVEIGLWRGCPPLVCFAGTYPTPRSKGSAIILPACACEIGALHKENKTADTSANLKRLFIAMSQSARVRYVLKRFSSLFIVKKRE